MASHLQLLLSSSPTSCPGGTGCSKRLADYEPLAKICSSFLLELFEPPALRLPNRHHALPYFIAMVFYLSQLPDINALAALTLLQRLKSRYPTRALSSSGEKKNEAARLFLSSYIAATKVLSDDRYRLQFWVKVGQNKFSAEELGLMEKEFFDDLDWDVRVDDATLAIFQLMVERRKQVDEEEKSRWRSASTGSNSSSASSDSSSSSGTDESLSSPSPTTPSDSVASYTSLSPVLLQEGMLRMKESEQNLAAIDQRLEALQEQYNTMVQKPVSQTTEKHHSTRHMIKEKLLHVFKS